MNSLMNEGQIFSLTREFDTMRSFVTVYKEDLYAWI